MTGFQTRKRTNPFVQIDKTMLSDERISWKAKGILAYLLSKPDGWMTYLVDIEKRGKDGRDAVSSGVQELLKFGYLERVEKREGGRFVGYEYTVYEQPKDQLPDDPEPSKEPSTENGFSGIGGPTENGFTENGKTGIGKTDFGKPATSNNDLSNNDLSNNDLSNKEIVPYRDIIDHLNAKAGKSYKPTSKATQRLIKARWSEGFRLEDFCRVIDNKTAEWLNDPNMEQYLRPATLFQAEKFESYLQQNPNLKPAPRRSYGSPQKQEEIPDWFHQRDQPSETQSSGAAPDPDAEERRRRLMEKFGMNAQQNL